VGEPPRKKYKERQWWNDNIAEAVKKKIRLKQNSFKTEEKKTSTDRK
jgi:hypothetical protein